MTLINNSILVLLAILPLFGFTQNGKIRVNNPAKMETKNSIKLFDSSGNAYSYPKKDWGEKILPEELKKVWDNPDNLYGLLVMSLRDGFDHELIEGGLRLKSIDKDKDRAYTVLGIIYVRSNELKKAEHNLLEGFRLSDKPAVLKTNLAKVYFAQGLKEKSYATLWEAIELDPNQDNAVLWIGAIHRDQGGKEEYLRIMKKIAELPSSWRAQLWIARNYLDNYDVESAIKIYQDILPKVKNEEDAMMMISGDLDNHGLEEEVMSMVYPLYDISGQDYKTGINIISACIKTRNKAIGIKVLNEIKLLNRYDLTAYLINLENMLNQISE